MSLKYFERVTYVVISKSDQTTIGPFNDEQSAIDYAKGVQWQQGYVVRKVYPIA